MKIAPGFFGPSALLRLLQQHSTRFGAAAVTLVAISGLSNAAVLATVNAAAEGASTDKGTGRYLALFAIVLGLFVYSQRAILTTTVVEVERILDKIRVRLTDLIRRADLLPIEHLGRSEIYSSMHSETVTISQAAQMITIAFQSALMVLFSFAYLAWISRAAFILTFIMTSIAAILFLRRNAEMTGLLHESTQRENEFFSALTHLLDGFKEVRLSRPRGDDLFQRLQSISGGVRDIKTSSGTQFAVQYIFGQTALYLMIGAIVFLLPEIAGEYTQVVMKATASILFIVGPLSSLLVTVPIWTRANVAAENIEALETELLKTATVNGSEPALPDEKVDQVRLRDVTYEYDDPHGGKPFKIGPINLSVRGGEVVFIYGGNGSGKSTFLKVLTGLYPPQSGTMSINRTVFTPDEAAWYRSHFTAVFSDYHLFDRLYGMKGISAARVRELLADVELQDKTQYVEDHFTTLDLSVGQKKRLALVVALLEDRPIVVFDEWAAEQDAHFRRRFYEEIVPRLKAEGKTVIAVTHDDRYFQVADRMVKMEYGELTEPDGVAR
jgi:putative ATP-binding cassette transporter